ncbi:MAG: hydrolase, TatD family [Crocinitomicaceae bacterium]|jgi:TatD DNase family protein|nr:hydrolase, TatD family [Crocinitomicaceae bacterium]
MYIDTHTHLYSGQFANDRTEMIRRALDAGVDQMLLPNIDLESIPGMYALEQEFPGVCHAMMGLHPCSVDGNFEAVLAEIRKELDQRQFIAIGEIGIDLYWDKTFLKEQKQAFAIQIEWAKERAIPIVIHARDSFEEIFEVLDRHNDERLKGVFHCFTGTEREILRIRSYGGFLFGIGGVVTFKKSGLDEAVKHLSLDEIILETDSPYLAPHPHRGKRNESSYIPLIADKLSDIFEVSPEQIGRSTSENARKLFGV